MKRVVLISSLQALAAAVLFGISAPLSKLLLGDIEPIPLAGFLYLGSGTGVLVWQLLRRKTSDRTRRDAPLQKANLPWLAGAVATGGVIAPLLLLFGLRATPAASASLLLNFEGVATTIIAALIFGEAVGRRIWLSVFIITIASILLTVDTSGNWGITMGALGVLAACVFWGMDNNLTRNIAAKNPLSIVAIKGMVSGTFSMVLSFLLRIHLPDWRIVLGAMLLGSLSYGLSITLYIRAMRGLGAARATALFATSPLAGILLSFVIFREPVGLMFLIALPLMVLGTVVMLREEHQHRHTHLQEAHEHWHRHDDDHHTHDHGVDTVAAGAHSHWHQHPQVEHIHHHLPDLHHRHQHNDSKA